MKKRTHAMVHCLLTPEDVYFDKHDVLKWHLEENGWSRPGYRSIFLLDGAEQELAPDDGDEFVDQFEVTYGAKGWNGTASHFAYVGGTDKSGNSKNTLTDLQMVNLFNRLKREIFINPDIKLIGHNQVNKHKFCPSFYVPEVAELMGVPSKNIDYNHYVKNDYAIKWRDKFRKSK